MSILHYCYTSLIDFYMTIKQKLAATKMVEYGGNVGRAMIAAGYSKSMAKNPQKLTRSKGWVEATDGVLFDEEIAKTHAMLLNSPDNGVRLKAVELGYKIRGLLKNSKRGH